MTTATQSAPREPADPDEVRALFARLRAPEDRPLPTDEQIDAFQALDDEYDGAIEDHLEPHLGMSGPRANDIECPFPIDVAQVEPHGGTRPWGALYTVGAGAVAVPGDDAPGAPASIRRFELLARLPRTAFRYWEGVVLEPFDDLRDAVIDTLGELARLPHLTGVCYRPPQIVATPDLSRLAADLPFAGALLRDARESRLGRDFRPPDGPGPLNVPGFGLVTFMTVTFLHAAEVRALLGPERKAALARLVAARVDEMVNIERRPVL